MFMQCTTYTTVHGACVVHVVHAVFSTFNLHFFTRYASASAARRRRIFSQGVDGPPGAAYICVIASAMGRSENGRKATIMSKSQSVETSNIAASAIRQALRREFGARKYRITSTGEIHVYGPMASATHIIGWSLYGHVSDQQTLCNLGLDA
jgi:hypothetical protein